VNNAVTGAMITTVQTYTSGTVAAGNYVKAGSDAQPNNLSKINAWIDDEADNTAKRVYGGDMLGYMWRFDFDDNIAPAGNEALLLGRARTGDNPAKIQPITIRPQLTQIGTGANKTVLVSFGTGRYLGQSDLTDTTLQSVYVIKDDLSANSLGVLRTNPLMVKQTMTSGYAITNLQPVDWATKAGWFVDLDAASASSGERITVDMQQQYTTLTVGTNTPKATACQPDGTGRLYYFDVASGRLAKSVAFTSTIAGITAVLVDTEHGGQGIEVTEIVDGKGQITSVRAPDQPTGLPPSARRTSWRELVE
jgi:type IV pilus assembly protein PilY1